MEYNQFTGKTLGPYPLTEFPTPATLRERYEEGMGFSLESENAKPLLVSYPGGEASRRYYQDAAIRSALEKIARGNKRVLLFLATGSGKTFIEDARFFLENYPQNYFSHIIIDECHRSAWGKWSIVLKRNPDVVQIGLTATPRSWEGGSKEEREEDEEITANNLHYFGEPVYEYDMAQGIEDGYLPACEIIRREVNLDLTGITSF
ncbi:MAG: DEAD/DEAH box helicase family protein [bacterium]